MFDPSVLTPLWFPQINAMIVGEPGGIVDPHEWPASERHLQCIWYDARLRPGHLRSASGEPVEVIDTGRWNLEAGPDFLDAVVTIGHRTYKGDVEIHIRPSDWQAHHHTDDPRYANVVLHVTWFPAVTLDTPPHLATLSLRESVMALHRFSFDAIDLSAYPHAAIPTSPRPCGEMLADATPSEIQALLNDAGMSRLRRKALRMAARLQVTGARRQTFYEECMAALGYKPNAEGMRRVAENMPVARLAELGDFSTRYAALMGVGGLLPARLAPPHTAASRETRRLWDLAWKLGVADSPDRPHWQLTGTRPINHPRQRLVAAAVLFASPGHLPDQLSNLPQTDGKIWAKSSAAIIQNLLDQAQETVPIPFRSALHIGEQRINTILINVVVPLLMAEQHFETACLQTLPGEAANEQTTETAYRLLGRDHNPALYRSRGLMMQGLLEIWNGFCLSTKCQCADCPFAAALRKSARSASGGRGSL